MNANNQMSALVPGFKHVTVAADLRCPQCGAPFSPHSLRHDGNGGFNLRCAGCERDAVSATLAFDEEGE
jgi:hypothetical protein